jgi:hypothetical protein
MADKRIKDLATTATSPAGDDFIAIDGATNLTRKIAADSFLQEGDVVPSPTFVYDGTAGTTEFIVGDIPNNWQTGNSALTEFSIGSSVTTIGSYGFYDCTGLTGNLTIPNSVTTIGFYSFAIAGFTGNLTIPDSVTSIGSYGFFYCDGLTGNLTIPNSVTSIGNYAFMFCTGLTGNLIIPNSVTTIGFGAFSLCTGLNTAYLNQPIGSFGESAFQSTSITNVYIGPDATGYTLGAGQTIGGKSGITVAVWTNISYRDYQEVVQHS